MRHGLELGVFTSLEQDGDRSKCSVVLNSIGGLAVLKASDPHSVMITVLLVEEHILEVGSTAQSERDSIITVVCDPPEEEGSCFGSAQDEVRKEGVELMACAGEAVEVS